MLLSMYPWRQFHLSKSQVLFNFFRYWFLLLFLFHFLNSRYMFLYENGYLFMNLVYALQISRDIDCFHLLH